MTQSVAIYWFPWSIWKHYIWYESWYGKKQLQKKTSKTLDIHSINTSLQQFRARGTEHQNNPTITDDNIPVMHTEIILAFKSNKTSPKPKNIYCVNKITTRHKHLIAIEFTQWAQPNTNILYRQGIYYIHILYTIYPRLYNENMIIHFMTMESVKK